MLNKKRIAWLTYHPTLFDFASEMISDLGNEFFSVKFDINGNPLDESYFYHDKTLSIPISELQHLNSAKKFDNKFYSIIDEYFDLIFLPINFPFELKRISKPRIVFTVFGREEPYDYFHCLYDGTYLSSKIRDVNAFMGCAYQEIIDHEPQEFKSKCIYLPIGLSDKTIAKHFNIHNIENANNDLAFVCSYIDINSYYENIYRNFIDNFSFSFKIYGNNKPCPEKNIVGKIESYDDYCKSLSSHKVLFYHGTEPRHLHYHPIEAILMGIPLIFMDRGLLSRFALKSKVEQFGMCSSLDKAKEKISRIIAGDTELISKIKFSQKHLLHFFTIDYCKPFWNIFLGM